MTSGRVSARRRTLLLILRVILLAASATEQAGASTEASHCFDDMFASRGYRWEGTCGEEPTEKLKCHFDGTIVDSNPKTTEGGAALKTCDCRDVVTQDQLDSIHVICDKIDRAHFVESGGLAEDWDSMHKQQGTTL